MRTSVNEWDLTWSRCELPGTPAASRHPGRRDRRDPLPPATRRPVRGLIFDAVRIRLLEIGEAVKALPDDLLATQPAVPWRQIARMRDHLAHRYFDTAHAILQATVDEDLPDLERAVQALTLSVEKEDPDTRTGTA